MDIIIGWSNIKNKLFHLSYDLECDHFQELSDCKNFSIFLWNFFCGFVRLFSQNVTESSQTPTIRATSFWNNPNLSLWLNINSPIDWGFFINFFLNKLYWTIPTNGKSPHIHMDSYLRSTWTMQENPTRSLLLISSLFFLPSAGALLPILFF